MNAQQHVLRRGGRAMEIRLSWKTGSTYDAMNSSCATGTRWIFLARFWVMALGKVYHTQRVTIGWTAFTWLCWHKCK